jgi:hypothetical protein
VHQAVGALETFVGTKEVTDDVTLIGIELA